MDLNQEVAPPVVPSSKSQLLETPPASQELPLPMLDVHPIHAPVRGWRDFFIHIATIVVGLCIAVAIQQTVEFVHNGYQLAETRQALRLEREGNYKTLAENTTAWRWGTAELQNNLLVFQYLQQHPGTPQEKLPGVLHWASSNYPFGSVVWDAARQSGVIALMPREEIEANSSLYFFLQKVNDVQYEGTRAIMEARRYDLSDADPSHLSSTQVASEIELAQAALTVQSLRGSLLLNLEQEFPDFPATVTPEELNQIRHTPDRPTTELLGAARALTMERMKAAGYVDSNPPRAQK
ncbi:MAG TPA: hypothetical protein VNR70_15615 [Steroidobacteraceae bacterium]|nr:hypothetical protein [Steroidobacteraceae bacterium]